METQSPMPILLKWSAVRTNRVPAIDGSLRYWLGLDDAAPPFWAVGEARRGCTIYACFFVRARTIPNNVNRDAQICQRWESPLQGRARRGSIVPRSVDARVSRSVRDGFAYVPASAVLSSYDVHGEKISKVRISPAHNAWETRSLLYCMGYNKGHERRARGLMRLHVLVSKLAMQ